MTTSRIACNPDVPVIAARSSRSGTTIARAWPFPYSTPGTNPSARSRRVRREPLSSRSRTSSFNLSPATAADCSHGMAASLLSTNRAAETARDAAATADAFRDLRDRGIRVRGFLYLRLKELVLAAEDRGYG